MCDYLNFFLINNIFCILLGDYDAILSLLLLPRMIWKSEILMTHVRDKYPDVQEITKETLIKDHSAEQFATRSRLSFYLYSLQVYIYIFSYIFSTKQIIYFFLRLH